MFHESVEVFSLDVMATVDFDKSSVADDSTVGVGSVQKLKHICLIKHYISLGVQKLHFALVVDEVLVVGVIPVL